MMALLCYCVGCKASRPAEVTRDSAGAKRLMTSDNGRRHVFRVAERCKCGDDRVRLELRMPWESPKPPRSK